MKNEDVNRIEESMPAAITFISQCVAAGVLAACLFVIDALITSWTNDVYALIVFLPYFIALCVPVSLVIGGFLWCAAAASAHSPRLVGRLIISLPIAYVIGLIFEAGRYTDRLPSPIEFAICFGVPTAFFVRSRIRPWKVFTFGTVTISAGRSFSRETSSNVFALLGSLPLRLLNIYLFLLIILVEATLARESYREFEWERVWVIAIGIAIFVVGYFISGIYLSYRTPRTSVLLALVTLFNIPPIGLAIWLYSKRHSEVDGPLFLSTAILLTVYLMLWVLCLASRIAAAELIQRQIQLKQLAVLHEHHCLGERLDFWQREFVTEIGGAR
jgi:hypothetical protein